MLYSKQIVFEWNDTVLTADIVSPDHPPLWKNLQAALDFKKHDIALAGLEICEKKLLIPFKSF